MNDLFFNSEEERIKDFEELAKENEVEISSDFKDWLIKEGFFRAPASTKYHGVYEGGLYDHCRCVFDRLANLTGNNHLRWFRKQSPFIIGMFHDLCKIDQYNPVIETEYVNNHEGRLVPSEKIVKYEYNTNTILKGHGVKSIMLLSQFMRITEEEMLCIRFHMGAHGNETEQKDEWASFDKAIRKYPNVFFSHAADMLASKVDNT